MGHYWHCCRVKALTKDDAIGAVNGFLDFKAECRAIDYGFIMAVTDEKGVVSIEDKGFVECANDFTLESLRSHIVEHLPDLQLGIDKIKECANNLSVRNIRAEIHTLYNLVDDIKNGVTDVERNKFDVFKDTAYQLDLLMYGLTDLNDEGYVYLDEVDEKNAHTFFVWTNSHM